MKALPWIGKGLIWLAGDGTSIRIGADLIVGMDTSFILPIALREYLEDYGICYLSDAWNYTSSDTGFFFFSSGFRSDR